MKRKITGPSRIGKQPRKSRGVEETMVPRLAGGQTNGSTFDTPEAVLSQIEPELIRLKREFHVNFIRGEVHTHDRGHRLIEFTIEGRVDTEQIADYLDSLSYHLYAKYRGEDESRWPVKCLMLS